MIQRLLVCRSDGVDPYRNLALEEALLDRVGEGELILYLWQNERTVVIGKNQNPWKECRTGLLEEEGGRLARRLSGGGAVFHDLGNLNFTFLMRSEDYDLPRQLTVIREACRSLGVPAQRSGRNDLLADGRKFSGNAFYHHAGRSYHHGTLMVDVDLERVRRYLSPSKAKLAAKGVDSVRSRVVNLREFVPGLSVEGLSEALVAALEEVCALPCGTLSPAALAGEALDALTARNRSWEWNYGRPLPFDFACEGRFAWGEVRLELQLCAGLVQNAKVWTDAMDWSLAPALEAALTGSRFDAEELSRRAVQAAPGYGEDLQSLLAAQEI